MRERISSLQHLKLRCIISEITGCWRWQGATCNGCARIWMFDHLKGKDTVVSGPRAAALLDREKRLRKGLRAWLTCTRRDCVNPAHVKVGTMAEWGAWMSEHGRLYDTPARKARMAASWERKCPDRVEAAKRVLAAADHVKGVTLADELNVSPQFVSHVRRGNRWAHLRGAAVTPFTGLGA